MSETEPSQVSFGRRPPVLITVLLVFGLGFVSGIFNGPTENVVLSGLVVGLAGTAIFVLLTSIPALVLTVAQSIRRVSRPRSNTDEIVESGGEPFHRRFMKNLEATMEFVAQGLTP
jgi:hypothetical protein